MRNRCITGFYLKILINTIIISRNPKDFLGFTRSLEQRGAEGSSCHGFPDRPRSSTQNEPPDDRESRGEGHHSHLFGDGGFRTVSPIRSDAAERDDPQQVVADPATSRLEEHFDDPSTHPGHHRPETTPSPVPPRPRPPRFFSVPQAGPPPVPPGRERPAGRGSPC
jgi:hypothetical protein